jgi:hypothetical protein
MADYRDLKLYNASLSLIDMHIVKTGGSNDLSELWWILKGWRMFCFIAHAFSSTFARTNINCRRLLSYYRLFGELGDTFVFNQNML